MWSDRPERRGPGITVAVCARTEKKKKKNQSNVRGIRSRQKGDTAKESEGWGRVVKHRAEANGNSGFNLRRRL